MTWAHGYSLEEVAQSHLRASSSITLLLARAQRCRKSGIWGRSLTLRDERGWSVPGCPNRLHRPGSAQGAHRAWATWGHSEKAATQDVPALNGARETPTLPTRDVKQQ